MSLSCTPGDPLADAVYPATYIRELSPAWLHYAATVSGAPAPAISGPFRYLELGCGQGLSTIVHAAAFPAAEFHACDRSGAAIRSARERAGRLGVDNVTFHAAAFTDLAATDIGRFDFVVAHGVYSWIDDAGRDTLRRLIAARLAPAGLAYLSYNCMPGWAPELPLRRLIVELAGSVSGTSAERVSSAVRSLARLCGGAPGYFRSEPAAAAVAAYLRSPTGYLAHELLASAWTPMYSVDVADEMAALGLELIGSATLADNHVPLLVDERTADLIDALPDARQRRLALDFALTRRFRRDLFTQRVTAGRGSGMRDAGTLAGLIVGCRATPDVLAGRIRVPRGAITFDPDFIDALRAALCAGSASVGMLVDRLARGGGQELAVLRNVLYLVAGGELAPHAARCSTCQPGERLRFASPVAGTMVRALAATAESGWVASTVTGGGVAMTGPEARSLVQHVDGGGDLAAAPGRLRQLLRLGILRG